MKKTLIALALATSAMTSYSAMAANPGNWGNAGTNFELTGNIVITSPQNLWEVFSGVSNDLGVQQISKGAKKAVFTAKNVIPVLGIRSAVTFVGQGGITPQIEYGNNALDLDSFDANKADFTLPVKDKTGAELGVLKTKLFAGARGSYKEVNGTDGGRAAVYASAAGEAFYGGVPKESGKLETSVLSAEIKNIIPDILEKYDGQGVELKKAMTWNFDDTSKTYSAYYGAGIQSGEKITVTLNKAPAQDVNWTASIPVTVSYQ